MIEVLRGRTALARKQLSRPIRLALGDGLLERPQSFFDYGCDRGDDLKALQREGFACAGWDAIHRAGAVRQSADVVNFGYIANVIESPDERAEALTSAWSLAQSLLIVAARTTAEASDLVHREPLADGVRTSRSTFSEILRAT
jgi:DNA phosphorothioation-associated putative methyltransferase